MQDQNAQSHDEQMREEYKQALEQGRAAQGDQEVAVQPEEQEESAMKRFVMGGGMMGGMGSSEGRKKVRYPKPETLGLPKINLGALFMPPVWGPAHGNLLTILFYPIWIFADDLFYSAYSAPSPLTIILAILTFVLLAGATVMFAMRSQTPAYAIALEKGKTREEYLRREKIWAIAMGIFALILIVVATWYNISVKPGLGA